MRFGTGFGLASRDSYSLVHPRASLTQSGGVRTAPRKASACSEIGTPLLAGKH